MSWETLPFEQRQSTWTGTRRQFRQHHGRTEIRVWEMWVEGDRVFTRYGQLGGKMQETSFVGKAKNVGKANAITAEQDALAEARRECRKRFDFEGYDEYIGDTNIDRRNQDISVAALLTNLPGSFCLYKPENNIDDQKKLLEKAKKGEVLYTIKRDGLAFWVVVDFYGTIQIYSRRSRAWQDKEGPKELPDGTLDYSSVVLWAQRFPHLVDAVRKLQLPNGTMMAVELTLPNGDNFPFVSGLTKGYTARAQDDMYRTGQYPMFYWWDVPFYGGRDLVSELTVKERYEIIHRHCTEASPWIIPIAALSFDSPESAIEYAKTHKLEGFVVVDPKAVYGDKGWNLKGKPDRPSTCAKLKPRHEDDFIAKWDPDNGDGEWGTGKHEKNKKVTLPNGSEVVHGGVGAVALYQYTTDNKLTFICKCSSGMPYELQSKLTKESFPCIMQVEYVERTYISEGDKTNALRFPTFLRIREDKRPEECTNERL